MSAKVLIIEKDINISYSIQIQFIIAGMDVLLLDGNKRDIELTTELVLKYAPDYIVLDLFLQNIDSFKLLEKIKQSSLDTKIFVYGKLDAVLRKKCLAKGIDYPFAIEEMSLNQFALKAIKIISNQEKIKNP